VRGFAQESKGVPQVLDPLWIGIAQAGWCLGKRQGLQGQPGGGGRVDAALSGRRLP